MSRRKKDTAAGELDELAEKLGHEFTEPRLLKEALTHPSVAGRLGARSYERLEFLGDRVLGLAMARLLFTRYPDEEEGDLARRQSALVRREALVEVAREIGLGRYLLMSKGEDESGGRESPAILADSCEAVIGALFLDAGLGPAARFIERHWTARMEEEIHPPTDPKTALQEWAQGAGKPLPVYRTVSKVGPAHEPVFCVEVSVLGVAPASARGPSKRAAELAAAAAMLEKVPGGHGR
ncbi:MAG: ribonuclease III [Alphaproteobacteria bacterium]